MGEEQEIFGAESKKFHFPIGMRIIKTSLAAFLCMIIDFKRGEIPSQSVVTSAICIQPSRENSLRSAAGRAFGTLIGAAFGVFVLTIFGHSLRGSHVIFYYFVVAFFMIPLIFIVTKLKIPTGVIVSLVVYLSIAMNQESADASWMYTLYRIIDTLIGIFIALVVNLLLPGQSTSPQKENA